MVQLQQSPKIFVSINDQGQPVHLNINTRRLLGTRKKNTSHIKRRLRTTYLWHTWANRLPPEERQRILWLCPEQSHLDKCRSAPLARDPPQKKILGRKHSEPSPQRQSALRPSQLSSGWSKLEAGEVLGKRPNRTGQATFRPDPNSCPKDKSCCTPQRGHHLFETSSQIHIYTFNIFRYQSQSWVWYILRQVCHIVPWDIMVLHSWIQNGLTWYQGGINQAMCGHRPIVRGIRILRVCGDFWRISSTENICKEILACFFW